MREEIDLENFCPYDWLQKVTADTLDEELKRAIERKENSKNDT